MKLLSKIALVAAIAVPVLAACTKEGGKEETVAVTGVTLDKTAIDMTVGQDGTETLTATVAPSNASNKNVTWTVADATVAAITPNGASCTVAAGVVGTTTITVTTEDGSKTATCEVTVKSSVVEPTFVSIDPETATVDVAGNVQLTATVYPEEATDKSVTWTSEDENIATVDPNGLVTGVANGTVNITVTTNVGGKTASCSVKVGGIAKLTLQEEWFSTNAAMQYVTFGQNPDKYGYGSPDWFMPIEESMTEERTACLGLVTNMWDEDQNTCYHTNNDWGVGYTSWGCREDIDFGQHNLVLTFPDNYTKVRMVLTANNTEDRVGYPFGEMNGETEKMEGGFVLYWSADGEEFVKFDNGDDIIDGKVDCPDWGSIADVTLEATEAIPSIAALKIESQRENDWTHTKCSFGIAELEIYAE